MSLENNITVSVIIPTYNRAKLITQTLNSVMGQTIGNFECLIVDDGSTDATESVLTEFVSKDKRFVFLKRPSSMKKGANSCRNFGFENARGKFIKWLDSDDIITPMCLEKQLSALTDENYDVCISQTGFFKSESEGKIEVLPGKTWGRLRHTGNMIDDHLKGTIRWQTGAGLWRKSFFSEGKPYLEGLMNSQEWLMHLKSLTAGVRIFFLDEPLCLARVHDGSMSHRSNKRSAYYYNQCIARREAAKYLRTGGLLSRARSRQLLRSFSWNHLFVAYKGGPLKSMLLIPAYGRFLWDTLFAKTNVRQ